MIPVRRKKVQRRRAVTVCVAAIAERKFVVGASDRMITAGDIEFEPAQAKMWALTSSIWGLVSGDLSIQAQLMNEVNIETQQTIVGKPKEWLKVREVAAIYCRKYRELLRMHAEADILLPLGLTLESFLQQQSKMHPDIVKNIADRLAGYEFPDLLQVIFMGVDMDCPVRFPDGEKLVHPQIHVVEAGKASCLTNVGFAAIGIGRSHAESQLMVAGHWPNKPFDETISNVVWAKKRAEVAPGIGKDTDVVVLGPNLSLGYKVKDEHVKELERYYDKHQSSVKKVMIATQREIKKFIKRVSPEYIQAAGAENTQTSEPKTKKETE